jgi:hypothetical protein
LINKSKRQDGRDSHKQELTSLSLPSALGDDDEEADASRPDSPNTEFQRLLVNIGLKPGRRDDIIEESDAEPDIDPRNLLYEQETHETAEEDDPDFDIDPRELLYELLKDDEATDENETNPCANYQPFYEPAMHGAIGQNEANVDNNAYQSFSQPIAPETAGNVAYSVNSNDYESFDQPEEDTTVGFLQFGEAEVKTVIKRRSTGRGVPFLYLENIQHQEGECHPDPHPPILPALPFNLNRPMSMEQMIQQGFQPESHGANIQVRKERGDNEVREKHLLMKMM